MAREEIPSSGGRRMGKGKGTQYVIASSVILNFIVLVAAYIWLRNRITESFEARSYVYLLLAVGVLALTAFIWHRTRHMEGFRYWLRFKVSGNLLLVAGLLVAWQEPDIPRLAVGFVVAAFAFWILAKLKLRRAVRSMHSG
jgi:hypothetical protein